MWCIDLTKLFSGILWILTIFNFIAIFIIVRFAVPGWNKTANKIFYQRRWGINDNSNYQDNNEIDDIKKRINHLEEKLEKK